jgi:hypothetical protein
MSNVQPSVNVFNLNHCVQHESTPCENQDIYRTDEQKKVLEVRKATRESMQADIDALLTRVRT